MLKRVKIWRLVPLALTLLAVSLGCGGKTSQPALPSPGTPAIQPPAVDNGGQTSRNLLSTSMPALAGLSTGAEFDFVISERCTDPLYQGSGRVLYDPDVAQPIAVIRGNAIPADFLFSAKLDAERIGSDGAPGMPAITGVVPYAFTGLPGAPGQAASAGEICRIKFRLLQPAANSAVVRLLNNAAYLQLRGPTGNRLAFDLQAEVAAP